MNAISLFSGVGIGEFYLRDVNINVVLANEIVKSRADTYIALYPTTEMICGDICDSEIKQTIIRKSKSKNVKFVLATPPCQGLSRAGSNKTDIALLSDGRNFLILNAIEIATEIGATHFLIENVPRFQNMLFPHEGKLVSLEELLKLTFGNQYIVDVQVFNAADYGVPQIRNRVVYRVWEKGTKWDVPKKERPISLMEAIGDLPSLEACDISPIKNHYARKHPSNQIEWMQHTPQGCSAYTNEEHFPQKKDGTKIIGYKNCYTRMKWDRPAPTITMRNEIMSSQENVHPGRLLANGLWSDARVLTPRELFIVSSLPADLDIPQTVSETAFRQLVGEGIPPLMLKKILRAINLHTGVER